MLNSYFKLQHHKMYYKPSGKSEPPHHRCIKQNHKTKENAESK